MLISKPTRKHETCNIKLGIEDAATTVKKNTYYIQLIIMGVSL